MKSQQPYRFFAPILLLFLPSFAFASTHPLLEQGERAFAIQDYTRAEACYKKVLTAPTADHEEKALAYLRLAEIESDVDRAVFIYKKISAEYPSFTKLETVWYELGVCYIHKKLWAKAAEAFTRVLSSPAGRHAGEAYLFLLRSTAAAGDKTALAAAAEKTKRMFSQAPLRPWAHYYRGVAYALDGQIDLAAAEYDQALKNFPETEAAALSLVKLGELAHSRQDAAAAKNYFQDYLRRCPQGTAAEDAARIISGLTAANREALYLQVAALADGGRAQKVLADLRKRDLRYKLVEISDGRRTLYKILAGPFTDQAAAEQAKAVLEKDGYQDIFPQTLRGGL